MILKTASLPENVLDVVINKGTEYAFSGEYTDFTGPGTYLCRQCGIALFRSHSKFHSGCGWPSFDAELPHAVMRQPDEDGLRTEIVCAHCQAHLGHVFVGEHLTPLNIRHCVNSLSLDFITDNNVTDTEEAIFAGGCFWGVEYYFKQLKGVLKTEVGYSGGFKKNPSYADVCTGQTGHYEVIRIIYDPHKITYQALVKYFFNIHDPTQTNGQGPDIGQQYMSVIFYYDNNQKAIAHQFIQQLKNEGHAIATALKPVVTFWRAESYHQDYYHKTAGKPYCHRFVNRFA